MPKISQLPAASSLNNADLFAIVQSSATKKLTAALLSSFVTDGLGLGTAAFVDVPISPSHGGFGSEDPAIHTIPIAQGTDPFNFVGPLTNGQLLIGSTGSDPVPATITAGTNISISNTAGHITISGSGSAGFTWNSITDTEAFLADNNGYVVDNVALVTLSLPVNAAFGTEIIIIGKGAGGWLVAQNSGQSISFGTSTTTTGADGSLASTADKDTIVLTCTVDNLEWTVVSAIGSITVV